MRRADVTKGDMPVDDGRMGGGSVTRFEEFQC
jgi:hypothetical protein